MTTTVSESSQRAGPSVPTRPRTLGAYRAKGGGRNGCTPDLDAMRTLRCEPWREGREAAAPGGDRPFWPKLGHPAGVSGHPGRGPASSVGISLPGEAVVDVALG